MTQFADTSDYQSVANIGSLLKAAGIGGEIRKATEGMSTAGGYGEAPDVSSSLAAGLKVGLYHFARPSASSPEAQAQFFLDHVPVGIHFLALDIEVESGTGMWALHFLQYVQARTNLPVVVYSGLAYAAAELASFSGMSAFPLWVADYIDYTPNHVAPTVWPWARAAIWQYTDRLAVAGLGDIDMSEVYDWFLVELDPLTASTLRTDSMIARDPATNGVWLVNAAGAVYTEGPAPYLGGINTHPEYHAATSADPVVGILPWLDEHNQWGYTIVCHNGVGTPATYNFDRAGTSR